MPLTSMWEAAAAPGAGPALLAWARAAAPPGPYLRREFFTAPGDRVLVLTWWPSADDAVELPSPPEELTRREVHRWRFTSVAVEEP